MIENTFGINQTDAAKPFYILRPLAKDNADCKNTENSAIGCLGHNDAKMSMIQKRMCSNNTMHRTEKSEADASSPESDPMKAKIESLLSRARATEEKAVHSTKHIDIRLTDDGIKREKTSSENDSIYKYAEIYDFSSKTRNIVNCIVS